MIIIMIIRFKIKTQNPLIDKLLYIFEFHLILILICYFCFYFLSVHDGIYIKLFGTSRNIDLTNFSIRLLLFFWGNKTA